MKLSVIVPTYQRQQSYEPLLRSIADYLPSAEVVTVRQDTTRLLGGERKLSRLDERYPGRVVRANTFWGFREVRRG